MQKPLSDLLDKDTAKEIDLALEAGRLFIKENKEICGYLYRVLAFSQNGEPTVVLVPYPSQGDGEDFSNFMFNVDYQIREHLTSLLAQIYPPEKANNGDDLQKYTTLRNPLLRLLRISNNLRDLASMKTGCEYIDPCGIDLRALCESIVARSKEVADFNRVKLVFSCSDEEFFIAGDRIKLERMLLNLIANAIQFSYPESEVIVELSMVDTKIRLRVQDFGCGMKPETFSRVYKTYCQERTMEAAVRRDGLGLGLPLAYSIAKLHQGSILIDSRQGHGTSVDVFLPPFKGDRGSLEPELLDSPSYADGFDNIEIELSGLTRIPQEKPPAPSSRKNSVLLNKP